MKGGIGAYRLPWGAGVGASRRRQAFMGLFVRLQAPFQ